MALLIMAGVFLTTVRWPEHATAKAQSATPAAGETRPEDREAVRAAMQAFVKTFETRDPKALASLWTEGGEFRNVDGLEIRGRDALLKGFTEFFARTPEVKAELSPETLRFLSRDVAIEEGSVIVRKGPSKSAPKARYSVMLTREEGRWLLASLDESPEDEASIDDLEWLIGEWESSSGQGAEIRTVYAWVPNKKFIHVKFTIKEAELAMSGAQVIGVDPATGMIHTWTFDVDGGVGEADWSRDGDEWTLDAAGTRADGDSLTETNILRRVNDDTFTWQSIDRMLGDDELPDLAPVKVIRVKPAQ